MWSWSATGSVKKRFPKLPGAVVRVPPYKFLPLGRVGDVLVEFGLMTYGVHREKMNVLIHNWRQSAFLILKEVDRAKMLRIDSLIENTTTFACAQIGLCNLEIPQHP